MSTATLTPEQPKAALTVITPADISGAGVVLTKNIGFVALYEKKYKVLLEKAEKEGVKLTPQTDKEINDFLVSAKACAAAMETSRKPFTQKANEFIKLFTNQENTLLQVLFPTLQRKRDASVSAYKKEEAENAKAAQLKLDQEKERINLLADSEQQIRNAYSDILANDKGLLLDALENCDLQTIYEVADLFANINPEFTKSQFDEIKPVISSVILDAAELSQIIEKSRQGKFEKIQPHYAADVKNYADHLFTLIPERRIEIEQGLESASVANLKEAEAQELAQQQQITDEVVDTQISGQLSEVVINHQINEAQRKADIPKTSAIESYTINVLKRSGWAEIFKLYFTHSDEQDLGKIKFDTMKTFAERLAKSQNIKIDSDSIEYEIKYKATAKRSNPAKIEPQGE